MKSLTNPLLLLTLISNFYFLFSLTPVTLAQSPVTLDKNTFGALEARQIGPAVMSGRISCMDALNSDKRVIYAGTASGGVWKSINAGTTFEPVFDEYCQSIGAITIDQAHPDTVWAGTGETWVRNSVSVGDGIYRTIDGGEKWKKMGLENTERIHRILIHPENPDIVFVAAMGHLWNGNVDRGVFKTSDGGTSWQKILFVDENTGCSDIAMDPDNPDILLAGMWDYRRKPHFFRSGGPGSGLYRSTDGGQTWNRLVKGIPEGVLGRITLAWATVGPHWLYALIEAEKSGLYRSTDKGITWELMNDDPMIGHRPFYFFNLVPDPVDSNRIYKPGYSLMVSDDGGKHFTSPFVGGGNVHGDFHPLWIDPNDNHFMYLGTDGGLYVSYDKANTWRFCRNLPVSQFYHVSVDMKKPYNVYGGLQDNGSWMGPSRSPAGITNSDWHYVGYGDGFNVLVDPQDDNIIYWQYQGGYTKRRYLDSREVKDITPHADQETGELRFNWNTPIVFGSSSKAMYIGSQYLFRSVDRGDTWEKISTDLTTNDPQKLRQEETGGLTIDNSSAENHCTIYTISESRKDPEIIWVGTDDGNLQVTSDGGATWTNIVANIPGLPSDTWCSMVESSHVDPLIAYVTFDGHRNGDMQPYVFKTADGGKTWQSLADTNLRGHCYVIREDPVNPDLLFLGTELGLFLSIDGGLTWTSFTGKVPKVSVMDMVIHPREHDLVLATHGRGIIILDDLTPLRQLSQDIIRRDVAFLDSRPFVMMELGFEQGRNGDDEFAGPNPPDAALITYYLKKRHVFGDMYLEIYDPEGNLIKILPGTKRKGINRVTWPLRMDPPRVPSSVQLLGQAFIGPLYPPGDYTMKMIKGGEQYEGRIQIMDDPDSRHSLADRQLRHETIMKAYNLLEEMAYIDRKILGIIEQLESRTEETAVKPPLQKQLRALAQELESMRSEFLATKQGNITGEKRLRERVSGVYGDVMGYRGRPTQSQLARLEDLTGEVKAFERKVNTRIDTDLASINQLLIKAGAQPVSVLTPEAFEKEEY